MEEVAASGDLVESGHGFNGATAMEPWKSNGQLARPGTLPRFNGATAMEPCKSRARALRSTSATGFNGATAMEPWKSLQGTEARLD